MIMTAYAILALANYPALLKPAAKALGDARIVPLLLNVTLVVLLLFTFTFLVYLNNLVTQRLIREVGVYRLYGLSRNRLTVTMVVQRGVLALVTIPIGLVMGVIVSKFFAMILARMLHLRVAMNLVIVPESLVEIGGLFLVMYLAIGLLNGLYLNRTKLLNLLTARVNLNRVTTPKVRDYLLGIVGLVLIAGAYYYTENAIAMVRVLNPILGPYGMIIGFGVVTLGVLLGTYWVIRFGVPAAIDQLRRRSRFYWKKNRPALFTSIVQRVYFNAHSLWLTTVLSAVTITMLGSAAVLYQAAQTTVTESTAMSVTASAQGVGLVEETMRDAGIVPKQRLFIQTKSIAARVRLIDRGNGAVTEMEPYSAMSLSTYNRARAVQKNLPKLQLTGKEAIIILPEKAVYRGVNRGVRTNFNRPIEILPHQSTLYLKAFSNLFPLGYNNYYSRILLVTDATYANLKGAKDRLAGFTLTEQQAAKITAKLGRDKVVDQYTQYMTINEKTGSYEPQDLETDNPALFGRYNYALQDQQQQEVNTLFGFLLFLMIVTGGVFMLATGSILVLKQLAVMRVEGQKIQSLKRLGWPSEVTRRVIYQQLAVIFFLPLAIGGIHSFFAIRFFAQWLDNPPGVLGFIIVGIYALVYSGFYFMTANIANQMENQAIRRDSIF
ncbi:antimicrobial peptide ABC transporter permease [Lacticaseibacillus brantae DSM 23927]|uniref:Antimicrobial peptide ABC transporter permease n=2 Tax=Lacticaseibacillus brantae TaxID=943673 RepID=A0A0R2AYQ6_9LACO|nr:antimicrobial peptide ABC transporter permease [Lacticaseibacillus brantae DSM 23927]